jgi:hypothetical protein
MRVRPRCRLLFLWNDPVSMRPPHYHPTHAACSRSVVATDAKPLNQTRAQIGPATSRPAQVQKFVASIFLRAGARSALPKVRFDERNLLGQWQ